MTSCEAAPAPEGSWSGLGEALHAIWDRAKVFFDAARSGLAWDVVENLARDLATGDVPMVFLKQFRDAADGTAACYQAIVEAPNRMTRDPVEAGFLHGDWELAIEQFPTVRLIDRLGLRVRADGKLSALLHIWVKFGFTAEPGQVIWRAV